MNGTVVDLPHRLKRNMQPILMIRSGNIGIGLQGAGELAVRSAPTVPALFIANVQNGLGRWSQLPHFYAHPVFALYPICKSFAGWRVAPGACPGFARNSRWEMVFSSLSAMRTRRISRSNSLFSSRRSIAISTAALPMR